jgi:hypothetical protein
LNPLINDFIASVEAVNDDELTVLEMHDAYADEGGDFDDCIGDFNLALLANFAAKAQEVVNLALFRRAERVTSPSSDRSIGAGLLAACLAESKRKATGH